ncbi:AMP-binding protein [Paracoccus beibuensis]|uniref:AMP-binding protein n=1 Tax=Paracoccus beibuensis TaxID=547602 RepID=UPI002240BCF2|nr:AMP-binding protein [Paracoccus beibuensis]
MARTDQQAAPEDEAVPAELARALRVFPGNTALQDRHRRLSFGELSDFVLAFQGALAGDGPVAVFGMPGVLLGAAAVGCVISGRSFVHLDPAMPRAVLANIVDELQVGTIVTCQPSEPGQLPEHCRIIDAQTCLNRPAGGKMPIVAAVRPTDAIYLVATSGTTGRPKCIPVTHDAAFLSYRWRDAFTPYGATSRVGIYIFAIWEMFRPLRNGARLFFPDVNDLMSPQALVSFLSRNGIDEMLFTPSFFEKTLSAIEPGVGASLPLRRVVLNGEVVSDRLVAEARRCLPNTALWNLYSICETHDISITLLDGAPGTVEGTPVGKAMPHLRAVVLDDTDQPCPAGQPGLLHFEGQRMLGPGYVNRPKETAQRFRVVTIDGRECRLYDTGDRGYVTEDGEIHVLGRVAHMLKLRGHSIQTRELTETLGGQLVFSHAIPWVQQVDGQGQVLVFYYTADAAQIAVNDDRWGISSAWSRIPQALVEALQAVLPRYCIPTWLARLDEIPINPVSGKCDFKALPPVPRDASADDADADALPATRLAARILGCPVDSVDPNRSFHDHGGDSLMCVDLLLSLEAAYARRVDFDWALNLPLARLHALLTRREAQAVRPDSFVRRGILLTGATGFLGGHVLAEAARHLPDDQVIYCLVRPRNDDPMSRLTARAAALGVAGDRFVVLSGTIDEPCFGLALAAYQALVEQVDGVIHCAAMVNLAVDRARMEAWSEAGIATIIDFCGQAGATLAFSSSTSVFPDRGGPYPEGPTAVFDGISGYGAAKIAAERAIARSGVAAAIVRLPSLYDLDAPNPKDIYETILGACHALGSVPEGMHFPMTDVRAAARFLVRQPIARGVSYCNLVGDGAVTSEFECPVLPTGTWLDQAPLSPSERRLLQEHPSTLRADAAYDNAVARSIWDRAGLGPYGHLSDVRALVARRLRPRALADATTTSPR